MSPRDVEVTEESKEQRSKESLLKDSQSLQNSPKSSFKSDEEVVSSVNKLVICFFTLTYN